MGRPKGSRNNEKCESSEIIIYKTDICDECGQLFSN